MTVDAYDLYSSLLKCIARTGRQTQVYEELKACETDGEIIAFVRRLADEIYSDLFDLTGLRGDRKNAAKAIQCRKVGNEYFHPNVKQYIKAVEQYNESIALSDDGSENLALAYANRSAVCFKLKEYADCLENIRLARENPYPQYLVPKLNQRETDCKQQLNIDEERLFHKQPEQFEPRLAYKPNPRIPHISNCIVLTKNDKFGRYLMTNRDLNAGDFILKEKPFSTLLDVNLRYTHCDYCLEDKFLTLIPCKSCTITMFCSEECRNKAWESYHRIECSVIKDMRFLFTKAILPALRTVTMAISTFDYNLEELRQFIESIDERSSNPLKLDWTAIDSRQVYGTIHMLATNQNLRPGSDLIQRSVFAIVMSEHLFQKTELGQLCENSESRDLIRQLIFRHSQTSPMSMSSMMFVDRTQIQLNQLPHVNLAGGSFPIASKINHSCAPNVANMTLPNGLHAIFAIRPIKKGSQLFDSYGPHHYVDTLHERQRHLHAKFLFKCECVACKLNYPCYPFFPPVPLPAEMYCAIKCLDMTEIAMQDPTTALRKLPKYCEILNTLDAQYPCLQIYIAQEVLLRCIGIAYAKQSLKFRYKDLTRFERAEPIDNQLRL